MTQENINSNSEKSENSIAIKITQFLAKYGWLFICYSIIGWIYEVLLYLKDGYGFVNRGFCFGPWLPIYGIGGLIIVAIFINLKQKCKVNKYISIILTLILTTIFAAGIELITTYILDFTGVGFETLWDYHTNFANFQGRIALWPALKFGIMATFMIELFYPIFISTHEKLKNICNGIIIKLLLLLFIIDLVIHLIIGSNFVA